MSISAWGILRWVRLRNSHLEVVCTSITGCFWPIGGWVVCGVQEQVGSFPGVAAIVIVIAVVIVSVSVSVASNHAFIALLSRKREHRVENTK